MSDFQLSDPWKDGDLLRETQDLLQAARGVIDEVRGAATELADRHDSLRDFAHTLIIENDRLWNALEAADPQAASYLREALA